MNIEPFFINLIAFLIAIAVLVTFHEWGHFWVARRLGVRVLLFSLGFGKPLCSFRDRHNTQYVISAIPLGGYVKMLDDRQDAVPEHEKKYAFNRQSVGRRFLIVLAGPLFNFIFAVLAYWVIYMVGISGVIPTVGEIMPDSIAHYAGMHSGEEIVSVNKVPTPTWQAVNKQLLRQYGEAHSFEIQTRSQDQTLHKHLFSPEDWSLKGSKPNLLHALGIKPLTYPVKPILEAVMYGEPGDKAGLQKGDLIIAINQVPIQEWKAFTDWVSKNPGTPLNLTIRRDKAEKGLILIPRMKEGENGEQLGFAGVMVKPEKPPKAWLRTERFHPLPAFQTALEKTIEYITLTFELLYKMIKGEIGLSALGGPVSIAQGAGMSVLSGFQHYLAFLALISISLGVLNLLPIPMLDGGHLFYYLVEVVIGKPLPDWVQVAGMKVGMFLLILLMSVAFYNDFLRLF